MEFIKKFVKIRIKQTMKSVHFALTERIFTKKTLGEKYEDELLSIISKLK